MMRSPGVLAVLAAAVLVSSCGGEDEPATTAPPAGETTIDSSDGKEPARTTDDPAQGGDAGRDGGDGGVAADSPSAEPESALEAFFVSGDPDLVCGELATERLLSSAYGDEQGCRQAQVPGATPKSIRIEQLGIGVESGRARALVVPNGGPNDGIETEVVLVREDGSWRVDSLAADVPAGP